MGPASMLTKNIADSEVLRANGEWTRGSEAAASMLTKNIADSEVLNEVSQVVVLKFCVQLIRK
jgi:hypothetical protein